MNKNLTVINQSTEVALSRANTLMDMTDKILAEKSTEDWMEMLWKWAEDNHISNENLPRDKEGLVNLTDLNLSHNQLTELPKEIVNLVNLTKLNFGFSPLTKLPKGITNLVNVDTITFCIENITLTTEQLDWFENIKNINYKLTTLL